MLDFVVEYEELSVLVVNLIVRVMYVECGGSVWGGGVGEGEECFCGRWCEELCVVDFDGKWLRSGSMKVDGNGVEVIWE